MGRGWVCLGPTVAGARSTRGILGAIRSQVFECVGGRRVYGRANPRSGRLENGREPVLARGRGSGGGAGSVRGGASRPRGRDGKRRSCRQRVLRRGGRGGGSRR